MELLLLLGILLHYAQRQLTPGKVATDASQSARKAAEEAAAAAARGDHATAAKKGQEAAAAAKRAEQATKAARTPPPWPQVIPADLPPYPSAGWQPASPVSSAQVTRAWQLLSQLWAHGEGTWKAEKTGDRWTVYKAQQMGDKRGVVAFVPVPGAMTAPSAARAPQAAPGRTIPASVPAPAQAATHAPAAAPATPTPGAAAGMPTLHKGARGPSVVWLQQKLGLKADGSFGPATEAAVIHYQQAHGLKPDGVVGPATWGSLGVTGLAA